MTSLISAEELAAKEGICKEAMRRRIKQYWGNKFPPVIGLDGKAFLYDRALALKCIKDMPFERKKAVGRLRGGDNAEFSPKVYTIDKDFIHWLAGKKNEGY